MKTLWAWLSFGATAAHELAHAFVGVLCGGRLRSLAIGTDVLYPEAISIVWPWEEGYVIGCGWAEVANLVINAHTCIVFRICGFFGETLYWSVLFLVVLIGLSFTAITLGVAVEDISGPLFILGMAGAFVAQNLAMKHSYLDLVGLEEDLIK